MHFDVDNNGIISHQNHAVLLSVRPTAVMQKQPIWPPTSTPPITTTLLMFWAQVFRTELRFLQKEDDIFCLDAAILKINDCC